MSNKLPDKSAISERAVAKLAAGSSISAIVPTNIEEVFRLSELIHQSGLSPYQLKTPAAVCVVLLKGLEIGLPPMAALENIGVVNGKACLHSDGIPALLWSRGFKIKEWYINESDLDNCEAHCKITRPEGDDYEFKYTAADAKENELWQTNATYKKDGKDVNNTAPWYKFKKRMLRMRARGWLARDCASDVLKGIPIYEEQQDIENMRDITPRPTVLAVPTDIEDGTPSTATVTEAEASQAKPEAEEPNAVLAAYQDDLNECETEKMIKAVDKAHKGDLDKLDADLAKAAEDIRAKAVARIKGGDAQGALV